MLFILALAVAVLLGAVAVRMFRTYSELVRLFAAIAGAIIGFTLTYVIARALANDPSL